MGDLIPFAANGMRLTAGQERALAIIEYAAAAGHQEVPFAVVTGYAGTGKTTLLKLCEHLRPLQLAPTGKAALRLAQATGRPATTIHRAIYSVRELANGEVEFDKKGGRLPTGCRVILCDEASMVDAKVYADLLDAAAAMKLPIVFIGDPFQLPPVAPPNAKPFSVLKLPTQYRAELTEVLRQALDNPIIAASMMIREGDVDRGLQKLPIMPRGTMVENAVRVHRGGGVVIVHRNATRYAINRAVRRALGLDDRRPQQGEPLLVMLNNYRVGAMNGEVVEFAGWRKTPVPRELSGDRLVHIGVTQVAEAEAAWLCVQDLHGELDKRVSYELRQSLADEVELSREFSGRPLALVSANFGYTFTAHKSQGSEWDEVVVGVEDSIDLESTDGRQWLYTAVTRAKQRCTVAWGAGARRSAE